MEIFWSPKDEQAISSELTNINNFIHIHPVSRWLFKCISDITMAQIIDYCQLNIGLKVVITASEDKFELEKVNKILSLVKSKPLNLSGKLSLKETAALNKKAKLFIGVDTSIMHISASNNLRELVKKAINTKKIVTVEIENINQLKKVIGLKFKRILFDNMNFSQLKKCLKLCKNKYQTEYSGNASLKNIKRISKTGINRISVGVITHSAKSFDSSLLIL